VKQVIENEKKSDTLLKSKYIMEKVMDQTLKKYAIKKKNIESSE